MRVVPNVRLNGKLYFKSLDIDRPTVEATAQMDGAKHVKFTSADGMSDRLPLFINVDFHATREQTYRANDLYTCQVVSGLIQKLIINDLFITVVSGTFQILENDDLVVESYALQGTFAHGKVSITTGPRPY